MTLRKKEILTLPAFTIMLFINTGPPKKVIPKYKSNFQEHRNGAYQRGLSLIEVLVVISVIGFLTAIATPIISNIVNKATKSAAQQTAKQIAQAAVAATASGNSEIMDSGNLDDAIEAVINGLSFQVGQETTRYELGSISDDHLFDAKKYLDWQDGVILFCPQGVLHLSDQSGNIFAGSSTALTIQPNN